MMLNQSRSSLRYHFYASYIMDDNDGQESINDHQLCYNPAVRVEVSLFCQSEIEINENSKLVTQDAVDQW